MAQTQKKAMPTREQHEYDKLVKNLAALLTAQCNLYARQVPDAVESSHHKARKLRYDVIKALQEHL